MHLAVYEPEPTTAHILAFIARRRGHKTLALSDLSELQQPLPFAPSAIIVAVDRVDEATLARVATIRQRHADAMIFLTPEQRDGTGALAALRAGVTDVIPKPYHPHELILRTELATAHRQTPAAPGVITAGDLEVDFDRYSATKRGVELPLTKLELRLLYCLIEHHPQVTPTERLLSFGWDAMEPPDASLLKTHISHLRKKLREAGGEQFHIRSRHSLGYTLELSRAAVG